MKDKILFILKQRATPIKRRDLRYALIEIGEQTSDRQMRAAIEEMITHDGYCIESSEKGYSLIKDGNQINRAMKYLNSKAEAIAIRKNCLIKNWFAKQENKEKKKQYRLEFNEETFLTI